MFRKGDKVKLIKGLAALDEFMGINVGDIGECVIDSFFENEGWWTYVKFENKKSPELILCDRLEFVKDNDSISLEDYIGIMKQSITSMGRTFDLKSDFYKGYRKALDDIETYIKGE